MRKRGHFIVFEGNDGAGKSTVIDAVADALTRLSVKVVKTREPGNTALGESIRALLLQNNLDEGISVCDKAELLLFLAARAQNIAEVIEPALVEGACVLCDRFNDSTLAYQGFARGLGIEKVNDLCKWVCGETIPDLTFLLTVDPAIGLKRSLQASGNFDRIESETKTFHTRVKEGFHRIASLYPEHFTVVDAGKEKEKVFEDVWTTIATKLEL